MKKFWKALTTLVFGLLLFSACAFMEPMYGRGDIYPVAFNHWSNGECYWVPGGDLNRIHCPMVRPLGALFWWNVGPSYNRYNYYRPYYDYRPYVPPVHYDISPKQEDHGVVTKDGYRQSPPDPPERKAKPRTGGRGGGPSDLSQLPDLPQLPSPIDLDSLIQESPLRVMDITVEMNTRPSGERLPPHMCQLFEIFIECTKMDKLFPNGSLASLTPKEDGTCAHRYRANDCLSMLERIFFEHFRSDGHQMMHDRLDDERSEQFKRNERIRYTYPYYGGIT